MNKQAKHAATDWMEADDESADVDTAIEALGRLIQHLSSEDAAFRTMIATAAGLVVQYCEHGGDLDGEATNELYNMLHAAMQ